MIDNENKTRVLCAKTYCRREIGEFCEDGVHVVLSNFRECRLVHLHTTNELSANNRLNTTTVNCLVESGDARLEGVEMNEPIGALYFSNEFSEIIRENVSLQESLPVENEVSIEGSEEDYNFVDEILRDLFNGNITADENFPENVNTDQLVRDSVQEVVDDLNAIWTPLWPFGEPL